MSTFQTVALELAAAFTKENPRGVWTLKDESPEWMIDAMREAHSDGRLPDDWIYENARSMVDSIAECTGADEVDTCEIADACVDVYTAALTAWLAQNLRNVSACDEACEEGLTPSDPGHIEEWIKMGQYILLDRACAALTAAIEAEADRRDEESVDGVTEDAVSSCGKCGDEYSGEDCPRCYP